MPFTQLTDDLWVLNRPARLGPIDLGHRMTVVRLASGRLWVHSPVALDDEIRTELDALGEVENFVAPSTFHDLYWPAWFAAYPEARFSPLRACATTIPSCRSPTPWASKPPLPGRTNWDRRCSAACPKSTKSSFCIPRASETLITADMAFNLDRGVDFATGLVLRMTGCYDRFGVSRLYKMKIKDEGAMRRSVDEVLAWDFNRIVLGHGRVVEKDGQQILKDAYDFLRS